MSKVAPFFPKVAPFYGISYLPNIVMIKNNKNSNVMNNLNFRFDAVLEEAAKKAGGTLVLTAPVLLGGTPRHPPLLHTHDHRLGCAQPTLYVI